jgi:hypothetical protein
MSDLQSNMSRRVAGELVHLVYLVFLVYLVSLNKRNKIDQTIKINWSGRVARLSYLVVREQ